MPIDTYQQPNDYDVSRFVGTEPTIEGAVRIPPKNRIPSQFLSELEFDGAPPGWTRQPGPVDGGYHAYLSKTGGDRSTLSRQTLDAIRAEEDAFQFSKPVTGGAPAPTRDTPLAAKLAHALEAPSVVAVPATEVGFPQGKYLAAISYVSKGGKHTRLTEAAEVTVSVDGQLLEYKLFTELPPGVEGQGLWLSQPAPLAGTPDPNTMRLQEVVRHSRRTHILSGPYKWHGRKEPGANETKVGTPKTLKRGRDFELRGGAAAKSLQPHDYKFFWTQVTQGGGESKPSGGTPWYAVENDRHGVAWVFHPKTFHPDAIGYKLYCYLDNKPNPEVYQLVYGRNANKTRHIPRKHDRGEVLRLYGYRDNGEGSVRADVPDTRLNGSISASAGTITVDARVGFPRHRGFFIRVDKEKMYVYAGFRSKTWSVKRHRDKTKAKAHSNNTSVVLDKGDPLVHPYSIDALLVPSEMPTEDTTGIEDPEGEIDPPAVVGSGRPPAGTYWVTYTRVLDGRETVAARPQRITIGSSEVIEMRFPERINRLPNALYGNFTQKGLPSRWQFYRADGVNNNTAFTSPLVNEMNVSENGVVRLSTNGAKSDANRTPRAVLGRVTGTDEAKVVLDVHPEKIETFAGVLEVSGWGAGRAFVEVVQYSAGATELDDPVEIGSITVATATENSSVPFKATFAGNTVTATANHPVDKRWDDTAIYFAIRWGAENVSSTRNLTVAAHSLIWFPGEGIPRRFNVPTIETDPWEATIDPAAPYHSGHVLAIGTPPPVPAPTTTDAPVAVVDHTTGSVSFGSGTGKFPSGWQTIKNTGGVASPTNPLLTIDILNDTAFGTAQHSLYVASTDTTALNQLSAHRTFTNTEAPGNAMALTADIKVDQQPTTVGSSVYVMGIMTSTNDRYLARLRVDGAEDGRYQVYLVYTIGQGTASEGTHVEEWVGAGDRGNIFTAEIAVSGANTTNGSVSCSMGLSNSRRNIRFTRSGINWTGRLPRKVKYGGFVESTANTRWRFHFDNVYVTKYGRPLEVSTPQGTAIPQTDRPLIKGDTLAANGTAPIRYQDPGSARSDLAIAATVERTATISTETTLLRITDNSNAELASIRCSASGHDIMLHAPGRTPILLVDNMPTRTDRFDLVVKGAGTNGGQAAVYFERGPGNERQFIGQMTGLDYTTLQALRAQYPGGTGFTLTNVDATVGGTDVPYDTAPSREPVNQAYVFVNPLDAELDSEVGWEVEETWVTPNEEGWVSPATNNTFAVFMKAENVPTGSAPLALICYNEEGREWYAGDPLNNGLVDVNDSNNIGYKNLRPGWREYVFNFSPPAGYFRYRVVNRFVTGGSWTYQGLLVTPGNLIANSSGGAANRMAARTDTRDLTGKATFSLLSRIPGQDATPMQGLYGEERVNMEVQLENGSGQEYDMVTTAGSSVITAFTHRYVEGSAVKITGDPVTEVTPAPLTETNTYYVRNPNQTAGTFELALTPGGTPITITEGTVALGISPVVYGYGFASLVEYRANNSSSDIVPDVADPDWTHADGVTWQTDPTLLPDYKHVEVRVTLYGDGVVSPVIPPGGVKLMYVCRKAPMLLRSDRSPLSGGTVLGVGGSNLGRPYNLPVYDTDAPGDRAVPRAITRDVGRLDGFPVWVFTEEALDELRESQLDEEWVLESPYWNMVITTRFYEPSEFSPQQEVEFQDERLGFFMPRRMDVSRAEVIESGPLEEV